MASTFLGVSYDAADAGLLAEFWAKVLGRNVGDGASAAFAAVAPDDVENTGPLLMFHQVPEGKTVKNRLHLDLLTKDIDGETVRLLGLGATQVNVVDENGNHWVTFADPEGNEFDVVSG